MLLWTCYLWVALSLLFPPALPEANEVIHAESLEYPILARLARIEGDVIVVIHIEPHGRVASVASKTGHPLLQRQAQENIKKWLFSSGAERTLEITYAFKLETPPFLCPQTRVEFDLPARVYVVSNLQEPDH